VLNKPPTPTLPTRGRGTWRLFLIVQGVALVGEDDVAMDVY
jgi:hypothetical protein